MGGGALIDASSSRRCARHKKAIPGTLIWASRQGMRRRQPVQGGPHGAGAAPRGPLRGVLLPDLRVRRPGLRRTAHWASGLRPSARRRTTGRVCRRAGPLGRAVRPRAGDRPTPPSGSRLVQVRQHSPPPRQQQQPSQTDAHVAASYALPLTGTRAAACGFVTDAQRRAWSAGGLLRQQARRLTLFPLSTYLP